MFPSYRQSHCKGIHIILVRHPKRKKQVKVAKQSRKCRTNDDSNSTDNGDREHIVTLELGDENDVLTRLEQELLDVVC